MESEEQEQCRQGTRHPWWCPHQNVGTRWPYMSQLLGHVARAASLEQGGAGWQQSSLLSACHKPAPKQMFHAAINLLKE